MKYVFLDIEWMRYKREGKFKREMLELGAVGLNSNHKLIRTFFRIIKPEHMELVSKQLYKLLAISPVILQQAKEEEDILRLFVYAFSKANILVVWNREAYELFDQTCKKYHIQFRSDQVIFLQEFIAWLDPLAEGKRRSMPKMLQKHGIKYKSNLLHIAKHDAHYLKELYLAVITSDFNCKDNQEQILDNRCQGEKRPLIEDGYSKEDLAKLCEQYHMEYRFCEGLIIIKTNVATWRVYHDKYNVNMIFHENYRKGKRKKIKKNKWNEGFHQQEVSITDFKEAIQYIYYHDRRFLRGHQKSRIDRLFEKIEQELNLQNM